MSSLIAYTVEVYKSDKRIKRDERYGRNKVGLRFIEVRHFDPVTRDYIDTVVNHFEKQGYTVFVHETYRTVKNYITGVEFQEPYDIPYHCSPRSETYFSN